MTVSILGVLGPKAVALQEMAFEAVSKLEKESAYEDFFRLHMVVRGLHMVNLGLATALMIIKLRRVMLFSIKMAPSPSGYSGDSSPNHGEIR